MILLSNGLFVNSLFIHHAYSAHIIIADYECLWRGRGGRGIRGYFMNLYSSAYHTTNYIQHITPFPSLVYIYPSFSRTPGFITVFKTAGQLLGTRVRQTHFKQSNPIISRHILILSSHLRLDTPSKFFPWHINATILYIQFSSLQCVLHATPISLSCFFQKPRNCHTCLNNVTKIPVT